MPSIKEIALATEFHGGHVCVSRRPPNLNAHKTDVDVVRVTNTNPVGDGSSITVTLDPDTLGNVFVNPPSGPVKLSPGEFLDLNVNPSIATVQTEGFSTIPPNCQHHDAGDIIIQP